jgi:hypothetical protein
VTTDSGSFLTFTRKRTIPLVNVPLIDVNGKEAESHEVETLFQQVEAMTEREREVEGVRLRPKEDLLLVSVSGKFAKTFDAKSHASQTATAYCPKDGVRGSNRAFFIKRPVSTPMASPAKEWDGTLARDLPKDTSQDPPNWPDLPPNPNARRNPAPERTRDQLAMDLAARTLANAGPTERLS